MAHHDVDRWDGYEPPPVWTRPLPADTATLAAAHSTACPCQEDPQEATLCAYCDGSGTVSLQALLEAGRTHFRMLCASLRSSPYGDDEPF